MRIPDKFKQSFEWLATMPEGDFNRMHESLVKAQPAFDIEVFANRVAKMGGGLDSDEINNLITAIAPIISSMPDQKDRDAFVRSASASIYVDKKPGVEQKSAQSLETRLNQLFTAEDTLGIVAKAQAIYYSQENDFWNSKIVTDVRYIFNSDPDKDPAAAVLVHSLHLGYHSNRERAHKEFILALDDEDLDQLQDAINRAKVKARTLVRMLQNTDVVCLVPDQSQDNGVLE